MQYGRLLRQLAGIALRNPQLLPLMLATGWRFRARDWYRRAPFVPLPRADYVAWRLHTAYGDEGASPTTAELVRYLKWTARMKKRQ